MMHFLAEKRTFKEYRRFFYGAHHLLAYVLLWQSLEAAFIVTCCETALIYFKSYPIFEKATTNTLQKFPMIKIVSSFCSGGQYIRKCDVCICCVVYNLSENRIPLLNCLVNFLLSLLKSQ